MDTFLVISGYDENEEFLSACDASLCWWIFKLTWALCSHGELLWSPIVRHQQFSEITSPPKPLGQFQPHFHSNVSLVVLFKNCSNCSSSFNHYITGANLFKKRKSDCPKLFCLELWYFVCNITYSCHLSRLFKLCPWGQNRHAPVLPVHIDSCRETWKNHVTSARADLNDSNLYFVHKQSSL